MTPLEQAWTDALSDFMDAYSVAAESAMSVPAEIYAIAPLAAKYLARKGAPLSAVAAALARGAHPAGQRTE